jgi:hypothetical protein
VCWRYYFSRWKGGCNASDASGTGAVLPWSAAFFFGNVQRLEMDFKLETTAINCNNNKI